MRLDRRGIPDRRFVLAQGADELLYAHRLNSYLVDG